MANLIAATVERRTQPVTGPLVPLVSPKTSSQHRLPAISTRPPSASPFRNQQPSWRCDTYTLPAAFPRSIPSSSRHPRKEPRFVGPPPKVDVATKLMDLYNVQTAAAERQVDVTDKRELDDQEQLYLSVNRYQPPKRIGGPRGLTLVFAHANGFHKETWEATIADLLNDLDGGQSALPIDEIWSLDAVNQGDSAVLNEDTLGDAFTWADNGRDILNFILSYIDSPNATQHSDSSTATSASSLSPHLSDSTLYRLDNVPAVAPGSYPATNRLFKDRLIVGIGHSLGGGGMAFASSTLPSIFSSVILVDPVLPDREYPTVPLTSGALIRRDTWSSKKEASDGFLKKAFFRSWDSRVLEDYVKYGTYETEGEVKLKGKPKQEAAVFSDPNGNASRRAFNRLTSIPGALPVHFIFADEGRSVLREPSLKLLLGQVPHATSSRVKGSGHLVAQEKPKETAAEIAKFLRKVYPLKEAKL